MTPSTNEELDKLFDALRLDLYNELCTDKFYAEKAVKLLDEYQGDFQSLLEKERAQGMRRAKNIVLRRTEIPKDAKNPTRDYVVILGEEIAELIERDLAAPHKEKSK